VKVKRAKTVVACYPKGQSKMWMLPNAESEPIAASGRKKKKNTTPSLIISP